MCAVIRSVCHTQKQKEPFLQALISFSALHNIQSQRAQVFISPLGQKLLLSATMSTIEDELVARLDNDIQEFCLHMISSRPVVYCFVFRFMTVN